MRSLTKRPRSGVPIDVTGMRYGILTAVKRDRIDVQGAHWLFRCDCGAEKVMRLKDVRYGNTASCGCMKPYRGKDAPLLEVNRPWRKDEQVDQRMLVLVGECCPRPAAKQ